MGSSQVISADLLPSGARSDRWRSRWGTSVWFYCVGGLLPFFLAVVDRFLLPQWTYINPHLHTVIEVTGATAVFFAAALLQFQVRAELRSGRLWLCSALGGMSVIGMFHALEIGLHAHHTFEALYSLIGGMIAALAWFSFPKALLRLRRSILLVSCVGSVLACLTIVGLERVSVGVIAPERISWWLRLMNAVGGLGFIAASVCFLRDYLRRRDISDLLFANFCLLSGTSACLFQMSAEWVDVWWFWHGLQLLGALFAAAHIFSALQRQMGAVSKSEEKFRRVFQDAPVGVVVVTKDRRIERVNAAFAQALGYEPEELVGREMGQFTHPDDAQETNETVRRLFANEISSIQFEKRYVARDGTVRWGEVFLRRLSADSRRPEYVAMVKDVTERKQVERDLRALNETLEQKVAERSRELESRAQLLERNREELKKSNERFETLARVMSDVVWDWDLMSGVIWHSEGLYHLMGYEKRRSSQRGFWFSQIREDERDRVGASLQDVIRSGRRFWVEEYHFQRADGSYAFVLDRGYVIQGENGKPVRMIGVMMDITSRKEAENRLREQAAKLARSNKDLEQFAYVASHDLKEPLRMVTSYVQLLRRRYADQLGDEAKEFIRIASDGASRMSALIDDLLAYSHVDRKNDPFRILDTETVIATVKENLQKAIFETGATIETQNLPRIFADETQITQLFQNLLSNALKYRGATAPVIRVSAEKRDGEWKFEVRDNGIGIESEYQTKIFKLFQRLHTKEQYPGTGIGLAICQKIVERHGGRIWVDSEIGRGATFHFTLLDLEKNTEFPTHEIGKEMKESVLRETV